LQSLKTAKAIDELIELLCTPVFLENIFQTELDNAGIDTGAINLPKRNALYSSIGISEIRNIKSIVEFGPELEVVPFSYRCVFDDGNISVMLSGTEKDTYTPTTPTGTVAVDSTGRRIAERIGIEVSGTAAGLAQSIVDISRCHYVITGHVETHLCPAAAGTINGAGGTIVEGELKTALDGCDSGNRPSIEEFPHGSLIASELLLESDGRLAPYTCM
jgi:hypothetical protein